MENELNKKLLFTNEVINKKKLQNLIRLTFDNYGIFKSSVIVDRVKNLTFHYATKSAISLSLEDLRVPFKKQNVIGITSDELDLTEQKYYSGTITSVERFQKVIDIWNNANNYLKDEVLTYFRESDPLNPLYIMAFSGARGNISQVRQLVGMRGLMADPQGQIIDLPIKSNFREGLKITEYIISSYGARKGLVDTALRTADSGYLTRRLVDVAQDIIVREEDCHTTEGFSLQDLFERYPTGLSYKERLIGRLLAKPLKLNIEQPIIVKVYDKSSEYTSNLKPYAGGAILPVNTEITHTLINELNHSDFKEIEVRSPLTCNSVRSVCRKCYGWHLSYSKIVDLGEAVGILAAQSIGEPGTQLTMRTFHTGGVFSGDLTKQIRVPFSGTINYKLNSLTTVLRTIHGEKGFYLPESVNISVTNKNGIMCSLEIPAETALLVNTNQKVYKNQVIAEIKKNADLILEEDRREIYTETAGEVFFQNISIEENTGGESSTKKISKTPGLIWVLYGNRYSAQGGFNLDIPLGKPFSDSETLISKQIVNQHSGIVKFSPNLYAGDIEIVHSSTILKNAAIIQIDDKNAELELYSVGKKKKFQVCVQQNTILKPDHTIAVLKENLYKTQTGGILYYSVDSSTVKKRKNTKKIFTGSLYWIPEETYQFSAPGSASIAVKDHTFVTQGEVILPKTYAKTSGFVQIDEISQELQIKPGELFRLNERYREQINKTNRFVKPGEIIFSNITAQRLSYLEFFVIKGVAYVLLRPVQIFQVPQDKGFNVQHVFFPRRSSDNIMLKVIKRVFFKDGEQVKSGHGVQLLQTFLVLHVSNKYLNLKPKLDYIPLEQTSSNKNTYKLKLVLSEPLNITQKTLRTSNKNYQLFSKYFVKNNQYIPANTLIARIEMLTTGGGTLISRNQKNVTDTLVLTSTNIKKCTYKPDKEKLYVKRGDLVRIGTSLTSHLKSKYAGQIYQITADEIFIRLGRPYLISAGTVLHTKSGALVERADILATIVYDKLKTVDIVQGLPKVEEILEARKIKKGCLLAPQEGKVYLRNKTIEIVNQEGEKLRFQIGSKTKVTFSNGDYINFLEPLTEGSISPHDKLDTLFTYYSSKFPLIIAAKISFKYLQLFLVAEVQRTYLSQGVQIADKHIEVIVKQMTSKVLILSGGDTTLLPGEILEINQAETITKVSMSKGEEPPSYRPILLGLTKASLNSDSFISAASFQETTKVLTEAAIEGKKDWLYGLKENVIIGHLIPAGTGFRYLENQRNINKERVSNLLAKTKNTKDIKNLLLQKRLNA